ncbi:YqjF family protein [Flavicella sediminum]|uniref:YqjF family protein n=1 Tax=Flavicella sediminum TaxID=2585141 RepID=UPI0011210686|nr:DUF2071 domain-containing protein [Flavicella sediminum]
MSFLKAEWRKLAFANYTIEPELLKKFVPAGTKLDTWNGKVYISLVGFMFKNTKLLGFKIPFHSNFEEVNLRFYVKRFENGEWKRGVVFIKEIVPKKALTFVANTVYKENYETLAMQHDWSAENNKRTVSYQWKKANKWNAIKIEASREAFEIAPNSETEFITEHYWGYAKVNDSLTNEYEVKHTKWEAYKILRYEIDVDFEAVYGSEFRVLNTAKPTSVMLAEGSEIAVENKRKLQNN